MAIVDAFKHWRCYCEGAMHQVQVYSDHQNLEYFTTTKVLNRRQARWAQELAGIDFRIYYQPGLQNGKPDALSRRSEYRPEKGGVENQPITMLWEKATSRTVKRDHSSVPRHGCRHSWKKSGRRNSCQMSGKRGRRTKPTNRQGNRKRRRRNSRRGTEGSRN